MADEGDLKSPACKSVWVQLPLPALKCRGVEQKGSLKGKDDFPFKNNLLDTLRGDSEE